MSESRVIERKEDMSPRGYLRLILQPDGDVIVAVVPDPDAPSWQSDSVEFCSVGSGGGRSHRTIKALRELARAMEEDNAGRPGAGTPSGPIPGTSSKWVVLQRKETEPIDAFTFVDEIEAERFYNQSSIQWSDTYLCRIEKGPTV